MQSPLLQILINPLGIRALYVTLMPPSIQFAEFSKKLKNNFLILILFKNNSLCLLKFLQP
ncbi:hypothetical protein CKX96_10235 [Staphylococcus argenteus]|nr:hypothetical protein CJ017_02050 [Staphylococcus argenteus]ATZ86338.1 hypothetical protein CKO49_02070 [Staphylococcus argenteus]KAA0799984.1 hypothetical protein DVU64_06810 [Staphylococcus argenteus]MZG25800.1 hypothetical protein [Staphylococcus argenteus]PSH06461.1 hypothetical protein CKX96_10235 [Staphylococcus argenteus]